MGSFCHFGQLCVLCIMFRGISRAFVLQLTVHAVHICTHGEGTGMLGVVLEHFKLMCQII